MFPEKNWQHCEVRTRPASSTAIDIIRIISMVQPTWPSPTSAPQVVTLCLCRGQAECVFTPIRVFPCLPPRRYNYSRITLLVGHQSIGERSNEDPFPWGSAGGPADGLRPQHLISDSAERRKGGSYSACSPASFILHAWKHPRQPQSSFFLSFSHRSERGAYSCGPNLCRLAAKCAWSHIAGPMVAYLHHTGCEACCVLFWMPIGELEWPLTWYCIMCMHAIVLCSTCSSATLHNAGWDVSLPQLHGLKCDRARKDVQEPLAYHATSSADCIVSHSLW